MKQFFYYQVNGRQVTTPAEYAHLIQMKSRKEIAAEYRISVKILKDRIRAMRSKPSPKKVLPISDVIEIYLEMSWPLNGK